MRTFLVALRWQFLILHKNNLINISIAVTILYALIFFLIRDLPNVDRFLTLLIFNDPAIIGLFFMGLSVIMEKNDAVLMALFVTPVSHHTYLLSKIIALSILGWACASGMALALLGIDIEWFAFSVGVIMTCMIFSLAGILVVSFTTEFLNFLLRSIPIMLLLCLPLLNYFDLCDIWIFQLSPIQGPLDLIIYSFQPMETSSLVSAFVSTIIWVPILYFGIYRIFVRRIVKT